LNKKLSDEEIEIMYSWDDNLDTNLNLIFEELFDSYEISPLKRILILSVFNKIYNDSIVAHKFYKYIYEIPRAVQVDYNVKPILCTHDSPSYPGGTATVVSAITGLLGYIFPKEKSQIDTLILRSMKLRYYSGVHYDVDQKSGLNLGRNMAYYYYNKIKDAKNEKEEPIYYYSKKIREPELRLSPVIVKEIPTCDSFLNSQGVDFSKRKLINKK